MNDPEYELDMAMALELREDILLCTAYPILTLTDICIVYGR